MKHSANLCHSYFKLSNHKQLRRRVKDLYEPVKIFADHLLKMASHAIHCILEQGLLINLNFKSDNVLFT